MSSKRSGQTKRYSGVDIIGARIRGTRCERGCPWNVAKKVNQLRSTNEFRRNAWNKPHSLCKGVRVARTLRTLYATVLIANRLVGWLSSGATTLLSLCASLKGPRHSGAARGGLAAHNWRSSAMAGRMSGGSYHKSKLSGIISVSFSFPRAHRPQQSCHALTRCEFWQHY